MRESERVKKNKMTALENINANNINKIYVNLRFFSQSIKSGFMKHML